MAINSLGQYTAGHKTWDHVGNITPDVEHSEGVRPAIEFKPAAWLPVVYKDKYYEDWNVIMTGKIVALDNDGRVVPGGYQISTTNIVYTQNDVDAGVIDVRTGVTLLVGAIGSFAVSTVSTFMGRTAEAMAVSKPIGIASYNMLRWAGGDGSNPAQFIEHNYQRQHQVAVLCDYLIQVPLIPAKITSEAVTFTVPTSNISSNSGDLLATLPVSPNTVRTPISFAGGASATLFVNQKSSVASVTASGDWYVDTVTGTITVYAASQPASITVTYYTYGSNATTVSVFASAVGNLKPGDFVVCDTNSNFKKAGGSDTFQDIIGQVLQRDNSYPKDALDRVRTAYSPSINTNAAGALPGTAGQLDQMPGSATGGMPAEITYAGAADTIVRINLISR
jgi:hypothetical protein